MALFLGLDRGCAPTLALKGDLTEGGTIIQRLDFLKVVPTDVLVLHVVNFEHVIVEGIDSGKRWDSVRTIVHLHVFILIEV